MLKVFISAASLEQIILDFPESSWYYVLQQQQKIYVDDTDDSVESVQIFLEAANIATIQGKNYNVEVQEQPAVLLDDPQGVYFLDIPPEEAHRLQAQYGVIVHSTQEPDEKCPLTGDIGFYELVKGKCGCTWKTMLEGLVSNTLIICDRYLFAWNSNSTWEDGVANIKDILRAVLPPTGFKATYQVLIIYDEGCMDKNRMDQDPQKQAYARQYKDDLKKVKDPKGSDGLISFAKQEGQRRGYNITVHFVGVDNRHYAEYYADTHNRKIVSNYFCLNAAYMLRAFRKETQDRAEEQLEEKSATNEGSALCDQTMTLHVPYLCHLKNGSYVGDMFGTLQRYAKILQAYNDWQKRSFERPSYIFNRLLDQYKEKDLEQ